MKRILLTPIAVVTICSSSFGQPVLTATTTNPVAGDSYRLYHCDATTVTQGSSGASMTWDFAYLSLIDTSIVKGYIPCASTPYCSSYPTSNLAGDGINSGYMYFTTNSSKFSYDGLQFPSLWTSSCTDPMDYLQYPFTYNNSFTDSYWEVSTLAAGTQHSSGNVTVTADAHGTLKLPYGTFGNVLRIHRSQIYKDSIVGGAVTQKQNDTYSWYILGVHHPILEVAFIQNPIGSVTNTNVGYIKVTPTTVKELYNVTDKVSVYPNPSNGTFTVNTPSVSNNTIITVTDLFGRTIKELAVKNIETVVKLDTPAGVYFVTVSFDTGKQTKKIIIQ